MPCAFVNIFVWSNKDTCTTMFISRHKNVSSSRESEGTLLSASKERVCVLRLVIVMDFANSLTPIDESEELGEMFGCVSSSYLEDQVTLGGSAFSKESSADAAVTEKVLAMCTEALAMAGKLFSLAGDQYAQDDLLEVPRVKSLVDDTYTAGSRKKVDHARRQLKNMQSRLQIAVSQAVLAENRLKIAKSQVQLAEDRVAWAQEQLDIAHDS
jgi:ribosomal protein S20